MRLAKGESRTLVRSLLSEIREHLAETPTTARPIPLDNWAAMVGLTKGCFVYGLRMEDLGLYKEYQSRLESHFQEVRAAVMAAPSSKISDLISISEKYQITCEALQAIARRLGRSAPSRKTILPEAIVKVARVGMTVKELAAAAGLHPGSLKSAKNLGAFNGFLEFETAMLTYPSGSKSSTCVVSWVKETKNGKRKTRAT